MGLSIYQVGTQPLTLSSEAVQENGGEFKNEREIVLSLHLIFNF